MQNRFINISKAPRLNEHNITGWWLSTDTHTHRGHMPTRHMRGKKKDDQNKGASLLLNSCPADISLVQSRFTALWTDCHTVPHSQGNWKLVHRLIKSINTSHFKILCWGLDYRYNCRHQLQWEASLCRMMQVLGRELWDGFIRAAEIGWWHHTNSGS